MTVQTAEGSVPWVNASGMEISDIEGAVGSVARQLARWVGDTQKASKPTIFNRTAYVSPDNPYDQFRAARNAVEFDDIVGGVADVTEGLIYQGLKWECDDAEAADVFNQISTDLNLDEFVRQWHREEYTHSQVVVGSWWAQKTYKVRGKTDKGTRRKKSYDIVVPTALTLLDPQKVVPLEPGPFGQDRLAWRARKEEFARATAGDILVSDPVMANFTTGPADLSKGEKEYLSELGVEVDYLLELNPERVFRFCRTKMSYDRFPPLRLKSVFPLLDLKQQLMEADRVALVGAINFILLVKQGSKEEPATQEEIDNLKDNFKVVARLPVIIGDHRLNIEIITPDQEHTLESAKYDTLDRRILARCLGALQIGGSSNRAESSTPISTRGIARTLEGRRHMMKRALEKHIARAVVNHPRNAGKFDEEPNLVFSPRTIQLDSAQGELQAILALRTQKELSRESVLEYFGFDQAAEAMRRQFEEESGLDDIFKTEVPFSSPNMGNGEGDQGGTEAPQVSGARGGRPRGGGDSPQSVQGRNGRRSSTGNASSKGDS